MLENDISVIITTYERKSSFKKALDSVLNQSYKNFELVVVDDNSKENYVEDMLKATNLNYKYVKNSINKGIAETRNIGIELATSPIICFLDDDDEYFPDFLKNTLDTLKNSPEDVVMTWSNAKINIYKDSQLSPTLTKNRIFHCTDYANYIDLLSIGTGYGIALKKNCFDKIGKFDTNFKVTEDTEFFVRLMNAGFKCRINTDINILINHHISTRQTSSKNDDLRISETIVIMNKYFDFFESNQDLKLEMENYISLLKNRSMQRGSKKNIPKHFIASGTVTY